MVVDDEHSHGKVGSIASAEHDTDPLKVTVLRVFELGARPPTPPRKSFRSAQPFGPSPPGTMLASFIRPGLDEL